VSASANEVRSGAERVADAHVVTEAGPRRRVSRETTDLRQEGAR
jgi:hypothetical protein